MDLEHLTFAKRFDAISGSAIREILKLTAQPGMISFAGGNPAIECLPTERVKEITGDICASPDFARVLQYGLTAGFPELRELLQSTGLGNHPVIVRTFNEIGKSISEDCMPGGKPAAVQDKTFAEALYGNRN